ncbi:MAG: DUF2851 family protein, partial [Cyclobacteriaceae bacterium]
IQSSPYWNEHYRFDIRSGHKIKAMGDDAINNIIINTLVPVKFVYGNETNQPEIRDQALDLLGSVKPEKNNIIKRFQALGIRSHHAGDTQALLQLKKYYCTPKRCLECAIGHKLVSNP